MHTSAKQRQREDGHPPLSVQAWFQSMMNFQHSVRNGNGLVMSEGEYARASKAVFDFTEAKEKLNGNRPGPTFERMRLEAKRGMEQLVATHWKLAVGYTNRILGRRNMAQSVLAENGSLVEYYQTAVGEGIGRTLNEKPLFHDEFNCILYRCVESCIFDTRESNQRIAITVGTLYHIRTVKAAVYYLEQGCEVDGQKVKETAKRFRISENVLMGQLTGKGKPTLERKQRQLERLNHILLEANGESVFLDHVKDGERPPQEMISITDTDGVFKTLTLPEARGILERKLEEQIAGLVMSRVEIGLAIWEEYLADSEMRPLAVIAQEVGTGRYLAKLTHDQIMAGLFKDPEIRELAQDFGVRPGEIRGTWSPYARETTRANNQEKIIEMLKQYGVPENVWAGVLSTHKGPANTERNLKSLRRNGTIGTATAEQITATHRVTGIGSGHRGK